MCSDQTLFWKICFLFYKYKLYPSCMTDFIDCDTFEQRERVKHLLCSRQLSWLVLWWLEECTNVLCFLAKSKKKLPLGSILPVAILTLVIDRWVWWEPVGLPFGLVQALMFCFAYASIWFQKQNQMIDLSLIMLVLMLMMY